MQLTQNIKVDLTLGEIIGHIIIWFLLCVITFGLALFVFPYYMFRFILSKTTVINTEGKAIGKLTCDLDLANMIGNLLFWIVLSIITFGLAYFIFAYKLVAYCVNKTTINISND